MKRMQQKEREVFNEAFVEGITLFLGGFLAGLLSIIIFGVKLWLNSGK